MWRCRKKENSVFEVARMDVARRSSLRTNHPFTQILKSVAQVSLALPSIDLSSNSWCNKRWWAALFDWRCCTHHKMHEEWRNGPNLLEHYVLAACCKNTCSWSAISPLQVLVCIATVDSRLPNRKLIPFDEEYVSLIRQWRSGRVPSKKWIRWPCPQLVWM